MCSFQAKEEKLIVNKSYILYTNSLNYWEAMPPAPSVYGSVMMLQVSRSYKSVNGKALKNLLLMKRK